MILQFDCTLTPTTKWPVLDTHHISKNADNCFLVVNLCPRAQKCFCAVDGAANFQHHCFTPKVTIQLCSTSFSFFCQSKEVVQSNSQQNRDQIKKYMRSGPSNILLKVERKRKIEIGLFCQTCSYNFSFKTFRKQACKINKNKRKINNFLEKVFEPSDSAETHFCIFGCENMLSFHWL